MADVYDAVRAGNAGTQIEQGLNTGMKLAQTQSDVQAAEDRHQLQQLDIQDKQVQGGMNLARAYLSMNDKQRNANEEAIKDRARKFGMPIDPIIDTIKQDPEAGRALQNLFANPKFAGADASTKRNMWMQATLADSGVLGDQIKDTAKQYMAGVAEDQKTASMERIAKTQAEGKQTAAETMAGGRVEAAKVMGGEGSIKDDSLKLRASKQYESSVGKIEDPILSARRATDIMAKIKAGDLKSTPALATELQTQLATLFAAKASPTVYGVSHMENNSAFKKLEQYQGYVTGNAINTITDSQLQQMQKDVSALQGELTKQWKTKVSQAKAGQSPKIQNLMQSKADSFLNGSPDPLQPAQQQQAAPAAGQQSPGAQAAPQAAPTGARAQIVKYANTATKLLGQGLKKEDIAAKMKQAGIADADAAAAMMQAGIK